MYGVESGPRNTRGVQQSPAKSPQWPAGSAAFEQRPIARHRVALPPSSLSSRQQPHAGRREVQPLAVPLMPPAPAPCVSCGHRVFWVGTRAGDHGAEHVGSHTDSHAGPHDAPHCEQCSPPPSNAAIHERYVVVYNAADANRERPMWYFLDRRFFRCPVLFPVAEVGEEMGKTEWTPARGGLGSGAVDEGSGADEAGEARGTTEAGNACATITNLGIWLEVELSDGRKQWRRLGTEKMEDVDWDGGGKVGGGEKSKKPLALPIDI